MKKNLLKIFLLSFLFNMIVGCTSTLTNPDAKHHHGKNYHHVENN